MWSQKKWTSTTGQIVNSLSLVESSDFEELQNSLHNSADRAWFYIRYISEFGSTCIPEQVLTSMGMHPIGNGTYAGEFENEPRSSITVYGNFTVKPEKNVSVGTVAVTKANFTIQSSLLPAKIHMDFDCTDPEHCIAHLHPNNSDDAIDLNTNSAMALSCIEPALSPQFRELAASRLW
ncbi:MAG: hypothetical protein K8S62_06410 [Candidatus Sabulitectum sp.]|nr:hypothetical protein [Candidatus Sabulitectum sp.]